jgi:transposase
MVFEAIEENHGERFGVVTRVARQLGIGVESLRDWVRQAEVDSGSRAGITSEERRRVAELERENRELRRANEILKASTDRAQGQFLRVSVMIPPVQRVGSFLRCPASGRGLSRNRRPLDTADPPA